MTEEQEERRVSDLKVRVQADLVVRAFSDAGIYTDFPARGGQLIDGATPCSLEEAHAGRG